jgi:alkanesulfonate monooxygenase SsuD/methylene tetrahydromethanopterin reductase-like flavin-dependent oxidoreductase (luciferase family)
MSVTGDMPIGVVLLAPFYHPVLLAEQIGTLAAFAGGPLIVTFVLGGRPPQFQGFGMEEKTRVSRLEEVVTIVRALLAGERVTRRGRYYTLEGATISPLPRVPVEIWLGGTVAASAERAGRLGDAWLTGQNATNEDLRRQLDLYREAAARAGRPRGRSCAATSTSAPPTKRRALPSAPSSPRGTGARGSTSCWWEARRPSSRICAATGPWASTT